MDYPSVAEVLSQEKNFKLIVDRNEAEAVLDSLDREVYYALDFETTSLDPNDGEIRITSIYGPGVYCVIDHKFAGGFEDYVDQITRLKLAVFNAGFEGYWIDHYSTECGGGALCDVLDVINLRRAKLGGCSLSLAEMVSRDLKIELVKDLQNSGWGNSALTAEQYEYAAKDACVTYALFCHWMKELTPQQWGAAKIFNDAWRGTKEMELTGLLLDSPYHEAMVRKWRAKYERAERYLRKWAPVGMLANLNSRQQVGKFIRENMLDERSYREWPKTGKRGDMDLSRSVLRQAGHRLPYPMSRWIGALMAYNYHGKYLSTYGDKLVTIQQQQGRISSRFNIAAAITGRYSSSSSNLQNIPKSLVIRRSFVANLPNAGDEYRLVIADYSSIEVRVLAEISGDADLLHEAVHGNIHGTSAADIAHMDRDAFLAVLNDKKHPKQAAYKTLRGRAKALTFAVCYGAGIASLAVSLKVTDEKAAEAMEAWARRYPKAYHYRQYMFEKLQRTGFIDLPSGRSIYVFRDERTLPVAANYGIQGSAADVMYRAVYHLERMLNDSWLRARMAATVHDELIVRCKKEEAEKAKAVLEAAMVQGWLDIFPGSGTEHLLESAIGLSWGDKA